MHQSFFLENASVFRNHLGILVFLGGRKKRLLDQIRGRAEGVYLGGEVKRGRS